MRKCDVLSTTTQPAAAARGLCSADTLAPGDDKAMSQPLKSKVAKSLHFSTLSSPKATSLPTERDDARATTSSTGKLRSTRVCIISRPTLPVAPITATL